MPIPNQPSNLIPRPFASEGTFSIIPDAPTTTGRASFQDGFPTETQLPLRSGGIAPSRMDFQGLFNLLTAFGFFQQSGGVFSYQGSTLNYKAPSIVFHNNILWWCLKENGPESENGMQEPGSSPEYWQNFFDYLNSTSGGGSVDLSGLNPVGSIIMYYGTSAPEGYFACDGSNFSVVNNPKLAAILGGSALPDMRGLFVRGYDPTAIRDPNGSVRGIGSLQLDAGRDIVGSAKGHVIGWYNWVGTGPFYNLGSSGDQGSDGNTSGKGATLGFDVKRVWGANHVSTEFRGTNICMLYCIKHD